MNFKTVKTRIINPPKDEIWDILDGLELADGDIVFITSKILAIHQGRCIKGNKEDLIKKESSNFLKYTNRGGFDCCLTITDNILIPNAGIDESNANGYLILWPEKVDALCTDIQSHLCKMHNIKNLGVISTDSHTTPLRWGVTGITTGFAGIIPLKDLRGQSDLFGRKIQSVRVNMIDPLTAMAVNLMGETDEQTPIVILSGYKNIEFCNTSSMADFTIAPEDDIYAPLLKVFRKN